MQTGSKATQRQLRDTWQARKSTLTRERIVDATIKCIAKFGYDNTTMARVAKMANASQGAMQYHFESKLDLMKAVVNHVQEQRLTERARDQAELPDGVDPLTHGISVYWRHVNQDHFVAYQELVLAARTQTELAAVLRPEYQRFIKVYRDDSVEQVPEWKENREQFELAADFVQYLVEGLAYGRLNDQINDQRTQRMLEFLNELLVDWTKTNFARVTNAQSKTKQSRKRSASQQS